MKEQSTLNRIFEMIMDNQSSRTDQKKKKNDCFFLGFN